jgi:hypothetical protein
LRNSQKYQHKVNGPKDAVLFKQYFCLNFDGYLKLLLLHSMPHFAAYLPKWLPFKASKLFAQKLPCFGTKSVGEIDP